MNWSLIIYCGLITFLTRFIMVAMLQKDTFNKKTKIILSYVPSAIFPAIIFPLILTFNTHSLFLILLILIDINIIYIAFFMIYTRNNNMTRIRFRKQISFS